MPDHTQFMSGSETRSAIFAIRVAAKSDPRYSNRLKFNARPIYTGPLGRSRQFPIQVLLIDGCQIYRQGLYQVINRVEGLQVSGESETAAEFYTSNTPISANVAIIDVDLPGQSGLELSEWFHSKYPSIPVLLLSYWDWDIYLLLARSARAFGLLIRNSSPLDLVNSIRKAADGPIYTIEQLERIEAWEQTIGGRLHSLHPREWQTMWLVASGLSNFEISEKLNIKINTVEKHVSCILEKLDLRSRTMLLTLILNLHLDVLGRLDHLRNPLNNI